MSSAWHPKRSCTSLQGAGIVVERDGQLGYAKRDRIENERLGSDLAQLIGVPVPRTEIGNVEGVVGLFAISHIRSCRSYPLATKDDLSRSYSITEKVAITAASGLLPFFAWIGADDHYDDTNLVVDELGNGLRVVAIDFEHAFGWAHGVKVVPRHAPPALMANVDPLLVADRVAIIENLSSAQIENCCASLGHPDWRRIAEVLQHRQKLLRAPLHQYGWLR